MNDSNRPTETPQPPADPRFRFSIKRVVIAVVLTLAGCAAVMPIDKWFYFQWVHLDTGDTDWHRLLRILGYLPTWMLLAVAFLLTDSARVAKIGWDLARSRAAMVLLSPTVAAIIAEVMKLLVRRYRPNAVDGEYVFRAFTDGLLNNSGLGMPSSHSAIAFAGMGILCYLLPRASVVWLLLAAGCAITRCINHAHFLSDAVVGAAIGLMTARAIWHDHIKRHRFQPKLMTDRPFG